MKDPGLVAYESTFAVNAEVMGLWLAQSVTGPSSVFTVGQVLDFETSPDLERLRVAAEAALREADLLRARFREVGGDLRYHLADPISVPLIDLGDDPEELTRYATAAVAAGIDPRIDPCAEVSVLTAGRATGLLIVAHHMVIDAYGLGLFVRRVATLYDDPADGNTLGSVSDLPAGESGDRDADRAFWARELDGVGEPLTLDGDPRPHRIATRIHTRRTIVLGAGSLTRTPPLLSAVIAAFYGARTDATDVVLGFPMMNRLGRPTARAVCSTVNVVPLRVATPHHRTMREVSESVGQTLRALGPHARHRGEQILRDRRHLGIDGIVGPTLNIKPFASTAHIGGHSARVRSLARGPVVDMAITCADIDGDLEIVVDADADLYDATTLPEIVAELGDLVERTITDGPESTRTVADTPLAMLRGHAHAMRAEQIRRADAATDTAITDTALVDRALAAPDDTIAAVCRSESIDTATLRRRVLALSEELGSLGAQDIVAVALPRGIDLIVALLAVHHSGAAFLPLDPGFPADRIEATLADAEPAAVIEPGSTGMRIRRTTSPAGRRLPTRPRAPHDPAYVIYTSGSTGTPKGVVIEHRALNNFTDAMIEQIGYRPGRLVLSVTTISFDIAILETLVPLAAGATVVLATTDDVHDPARLAALIGAHGIDVMQATPSLWSALLETGQAGALAEVDVLVGGEVLPADVATGLAGAARSVRNMYGPTETTIWSTSAPVGRAEVSIGDPIANTGVRILDSALRPVADGRVGELYLSGAGLARGYHRRPSMTSGRFVADPFGEPGTRMYRTGDLARRGADGALRCLGRTDHQVKIRGFRIELGDIDSALAGHDSVERAVTTAVDGRLVSYVTSPAASVGTENSGPDPMALRAHLADRLPDYMIPAAIVGVDRFPLTPNGKVDRRALPRPDFGAVAGTGRPPLGDVELVLAQAFSITLGVAAVGADDDFFLLGGDSLTAVRAVAAAARAGLVITPIDVFDHPTVARLATIARRESAPLPRPVVDTAADDLALTTAGIGAGELADLTDGDLL